MLHVFIYSDSLTWGIIPNSRRRLPFGQRWPGILEKKLNESSHQVRITEDCLNGRRTVWEDPFKPGRNGVDGLAQRIEAQSPLALVILMLGTNDFQFCHPYNNAWSAGQGMITLIKEIREAPIEPGMPVPPILLIAPPPIGQPQGVLAQKFSGADKRCIGLADVYRQISSDLACHFFDAGSATPSSRVDGIHLDADQHILLGEALAPIVAPILPNPE